MYFIACYCDDVDRNKKRQPKKNMKRQSYTHNARLQNRQALSRGYATLAVTAISRGLLASIHAEIEPQLAAMRRADDILERCTRTHNGIESQGYANMPDCSRLEIHTMGNLRGSESLVSGESFEACALQGMAIAETTTRNVADNN